MNQIVALSTELQTRLQQLAQPRNRELDERGSVTLEQVIITAALAVVAALVVAAIVAAVNKYIGKIG